MYKDNSICVVVPAYNEEKLIGRFLRMPVFGTSAALMPNIIRSGDY